MSTPLLRDLPQALATARLSIRCPRAGDGATVHASVAETLAALRAYPASLPWALEEPSPQASEKFCRESHASYLMRTGFPMLLFLKGTDVHVGSSGLHTVDWSVPKCEIGYWIRARFMGQGYATEAVRAITAFAFEQLGMRRIEALPDAENVASARVLERTGYGLEGTFRHDRAEPDGTLRDTRVYAVIR
jgi:RimJ/RimL family protein N-acetyltransferase